jgi:L-alanine-DL-glutamate epimerase-like enolase superfamily enzyme
MDMALFDLEYQQSFTTLKVGTDVTVPIAHIDALDFLIGERASQGFSVFKVKLALERVELSLEKLIKIQELIGVDGRIRVDPNQSWSLEHTLQFLKAIEAADLKIEFLEQPTPAADKVSLSVIRKQSSVKIMADESCFGMKDLLELIELEAVDLINVKLLKSGGLYSSFRVAEVAAEAGIEVLVGSMMEGDVGVSHALRLAHQISPFAVHDLDAAWWAKNSVLEYKEGAVVL